MSKLFLIESVPQSAEYFLTPDFFAKSGAPSLDRLASQLQIVDPRTLAYDIGDFESAIIEN